MESIFFGVYKTMESMESNYFVRFIIILLLYYRSLGIIQITAWVFSLHFPFSHSTREIISVLSALWMQQQRRLVSRLAVMNLGGL